MPDWSEIRCRFPPKSPAAFDRNQVPVCSDFCKLENWAAWLKWNRDEALFASMYSAYDALSDGLKATIEGAAGTPQVRT